MAEETSSGKTLDAYEALDKLSDERKLETAAAIGTVTLAWNKLQESLAHLFAAILYDDEAAAFAIWHSSKSDLAQREMLRAGCLANRTRLRADVCDEIEWLLDEANTLSTKRNDTIHTHFSLRLLGNDIAYLPDTWTGSPHAKRLSGRDPLKTFGRYSVWASRLSQYAVDLMAYVGSPRDTSPLPDRPQKPS